MPVTQSDFTIHTLARQLAELIPAMRVLLKPGGRERGPEPPPPEIRAQFRMMTFIVSLIPQRSFPSALQL